MGELGVKGFGSVPITFYELDEIIDLINKVYGFDFSGYSTASLKRRITRIMHLHQLQLYDLKMLLVNDPAFFDKFLIELTVTVTEMFRDPSFYKALREKVFPYLSSYPRIKLWNAGCSSGEETYSYAILLEEEDIYKRSFIYGTDINSDILETARRGVYDLRKMKLYSENYMRSGAMHSLSEYYTTESDKAAIHPRLKKNLLFSMHNLVSDGVFNEFQLISCRNVLIYFNLGLQKKVIQLFYDSLCPLGFLCLGSKESLRGEENMQRFRVIDTRENIFQKIA